MADQIADPIGEYLKTVSTTDTVRAAVWDAFHQAANEDDFATALKRMPLPQHVKAELWDRKAHESSSPQAQEPVAPERTWMDTAKDVAIGAMKGAAHTALNLGETIAAAPAYVPGKGLTKIGDVTNAVGNAIGGAVGQALYGTKAEPVPNTAAFDQARQSTAYENAPQMAGGALETAAELALPVAEAAQAIPQTARAAKNFQAVMGAAKDLPVDITAPGNVALRIQQLAERGGSMPMAVRKFLVRITDPDQGPLTYEQARDFASNISRLSANEYGRLTPVISREVANLRVALNQAIGQTASRAGKGAEYAAAMNEYAKAMRLRSFFEEALQGAKQNLPWASVAGTGYYVGQKLKALLGE